MAEWMRACLEPNANLREAMQAIDAGALQIAFVVDERRHLQGVVTDGDIRRAILAGAELSHPVSTIMNRRPRVLPAGHARAEALALMREARIHQIPVIDAAGVLVDVLVLDDLVRAPLRENWVVLMAGGLGTRLRPLTDHCPKPMLKLGGRPLLETVIRRLRDQGFRRFYLSVNYLAEMIERHFGDGTELGVSIRYLREQQRLGTGGALSLLPEAPAAPLVVANGDILTTIDFAQMVDFHVAQAAEATMGIRDYEVSIPYGVVDTDGTRITGMREKPMHRYFVNAGVYVLSPSAVAEIPPGQMYDMPTLFERLQALECRTAAFHVREYWLDIGRPEDLQRAEAEFAAVFGR